MAPDETQVDDFAPDDKVVPVVDQQGTALASGVGDPVAIQGGLPDAGSTSDVVREPTETEVAASHGDDEALRELADQNAAPDGVTNADVDQPTGGAATVSTDADGTQTVTTETPTGDGGADPSVSGSAGTDATRRPLYVVDGDHTDDTANWPRAPFGTSDGRPLFYFSGDQDGGQPTGDGLGGVWHAYTGDTVPA